MSRLDAIRFKRFRHEARMTQKQLARALGMSRRGVVKIEKGTTCPHQSTMKKFEALVARHEDVLLLPNPRDWSHNVTDQG